MVYDTGVATEAAEFVAYLWGIEIQESFLIDRQSACVCSLPMRDWNLEDVLELLNCHASL